MDVHRCSVRVRSGESGARVYARKNHFDVRAPISFDAEYTGLSALDYVLGAVAGELVSGLTNLAGRQRIELAHVEAIAYADLGNPLVCLGTVGADGDPRLQAISVKLYVDTAADAGRVHGLLAEVLRRAPLWNTLRPSLQYDVQLELT